MRKETDMNGLKKLARVFLMMDPQPTKFSPMIVKHPFTDSGITALKTGDEYQMVNLMDDTAALDRWRMQIQENIDEAERPVHIYMGITKPYRLAFLKYAMPYLSRTDFSEYLADAWVICEEPNRDPNFTQRQLLSLFQKANPQALMNEEEYRQFQALEDTVTIYRGVTAYNAGSAKSLSWTLKRETAEWFAHRFGENGKVYQAQIDKSHIYALFTSRNEAEVIVDPKYLMNMKEVPRQNMGFQMKMK